MSMPSSVPKKIQAKHAPRQFINPHRLFHGVRMPQWLEERPEVSEKAKKLYAYLTYFAGGKGYAWPTFNTLAERLHASRRHVIRLVKELSTHCLILITNVNHPERGSCANCYRSFGTLGCSHIRKYPTSSQNPVIQHQENQRWAQILASPQKLEEAQNHRMGSGRRPRPRNISSRSTNSIPPRTCMPRWSIATCCCRRRSRAVPRRRGRSNRRAGHAVAATSRRVARGVTPQGRSPSRSMRARV